MVITRLVGGLGNQMFQYAAGRALAIRLGVPLKLDFSWFDDMGGCTPREYLLHIFPIAATEANPEEIESIAYRKQNFFERLLRCTKKHCKHYKKLLRWSKKRSKHYIVEPSYNYWSGFASVVAPTYLKGYWQQEKYFADITDVIRQDFSFPPFGNPETAKLAAEISSTSNAVCVHIRRGDYVKKPANFISVYSPAYYEKALRTLSTKLGSALKLFIFTDDPAWARGNFDTLGYPALIIDFPEHQDKPWHDMHLMSLCEHHVIANSSFSWWAAWLSRGNGITIAPERWFAAAKSQNDTPVPARWIKI